nr:MAG TPA: hypothetical protein [Caudoviricetes sp.]
MNISSNYIKRTSTTLRLTRCTIGVSSNVQTVGCVTLRSLVTNKSMTSSVTGIPTADKLRTN